MTITNYIYPLGQTNTSSSVLDKTGKIEEKQNSFFYRSALGFIVLLMSASISTEISYNSKILETNSTTLIYQNLIGNNLGINVLQNFVSNLLVNSENLDNDIIELINENFWDLI